MAEVHVLPGVERRDLAGRNLGVDEVLMQAAGEGLSEVVVVGRDRGGVFYIASSMQDADRCVGYLVRAANVIASSDVISAPFDTEAEPKA